MISMESSHDAGGGVIIDAIPRIEKMKRMKEAIKMAKSVSGTVVSEQIPLTEFDDTGNTWVVFQRPKRRESEKLAIMQAQSELIYNTDAQGEVRQRDRIPLTVIESQMVCLCLVESNLSYEDGKQLFIPGQTCRMTKKQVTIKVDDGFNQAWGDLDDDLADEIVDKLREWHPPFNWRADQGED